MATWGGRFGNLAGDRRRTRPAVKRAARVDVTFKREQQTTVLKSRFKRDSGGGERYPYPMAGTPIGGGQEPPFRMVGYARVSTEDQDNAGQRAELLAAGCSVVFEEKASGSRDNRPELARCLKLLRAGDTLVVARLDRLGRSVTHLLTTLERLRGRGVHFKSLRDNVDTSTASGKFLLAILASVAEFERDLIRERTLAGLATARREGRVGGNPKLRARDPSTLRLMRLARADAELNRLRDVSLRWRGLVERLRPHESWEAIARRINGQLPNGDKPMTADRLRSQVNRLVRSGDIPEHVLQRASPRSANRPDKRIAAALFARALRSDDPTISLRAIAERLLDEGHSPPRKARWSAESVRRLLAIKPADRCERSY